MPEKMYAFTHLISETKLLALIATNADQAKVEIYTPEKRKSYYKPRGVQNGHAPLSALAAPLMIEAPDEAKATTPKAKSKTKNGKSPRGFGAGHFIVEYATKHKDRSVTMQEMIAAAKAKGLSPGSLSVAMTGVMRKGYIERTGKGEYKVLKDGIKQIEQKLPVTTQPTSKGTNKGTN